VSEDGSLPINTPENAVMVSLSSVLLKYGTPSILVDIKGVVQRLIPDTWFNVSIRHPGISGSVVEVTHIDHTE